MIIHIPDINSESQIPIIPIAILSSRTITVEGQSKPQELIQWKGLPMEDSSWEDYDIVRKMFPHLNLEDQVQFDGVQNVPKQTVAGKNATAVGEDATVIVENQTEEESSNS